MIVPLTLEITEFVKFGKENRITVFLQNEADKSYLNIPESVLLYTTPETYITGINLSTDLISNVGYLFFNVSHSSFKDLVNISILVRDRQNILIANEKSENAGVIRIDDIKTWWPNLMNSDPGYLYHIEVRLLSLNNTLLDSYKLKTGFRTLKWDSTDLMVNGKIAYLHGFEFDVTMKTWKALNDISKLNGNTILLDKDFISHDILSMADELGILVIVNCFGKIETFDQMSLNNHKMALENTVNDYKNHPCVVLWSLGVVSDLLSFGGTSYFK